MSGVALPPDLRAGLAKFARGATIEHAATLSANYRVGGGSGRIADDAAVAAYLTARLPATYAAVTAAMHAVAERAHGFVPRTLLDAGAGPGTASWAAIGVWPGIEKIAMVDSNPHLLAAARALATGAAHPALAGAEMRLGALTQPDAGMPADCVVASYVLAESPETHAGALATRLWTLTGSALIIVEPGTPAGFARIRIVRDALTAQGAHIVAPCMGAYACPMTGADWCHFAVRLPRSREHMRAKGADVPFEDEKFSYIAAAREHIALKPPTARVLARPHRMKPGVRLKLCTEDGLEDRMVPARNRAAFKAATKLDWGDAL